MNEYTLKLLEAGIRAADMNGVSVGLDELIGRARRRPVPWLRNMAMDTLSGRGFSKSEIGRIFRRNHATITHGLNHVRAVVGNATYVLENAIYEDYLKLIADSDGEKTRR